MLGEYVAITMMCAMTSVLFLGGWAVPFSWFGWHTEPPGLFGGVPNWMNVIGPLVLFTKMMLIMFVIFWFAGIFYLPRLFVYHAMATDRISIERFKVMERRLLKFIMTPAMIVTWRRCSSVGLYLCRPAI